MKKIISTIIFSLLLTSLIFIGFLTYNGAKEYENKTTEIVKTQNIKDLTKSNLKNITSKISFGWFKNKAKEKIEEIKQKKEIIGKNNFMNIIYFSLLVIIILLSYFFIDLKSFNIFGSLMTIIILIYGLITPLLMVTIHKDVDYIGDVVLSFESKSLIGSISKLFESGDYVIASIIILFSVIIPLFKTISLFLISIFQDNFFTHKLIGFFKLIGKWSMLDVFVVAVLLVFLSANKGDISKAEVEVGLYIFVLYVISSMFISLSADKMIKQIKGI